MYPHERSLVKEMEGKPFALIGVNSDSLEDARKACKEKDLTWRSFQNSVEGKKDIADDWAIEGWPTIVIIDAKGEIHYRGHDGNEATEIAEKLVEGMTGANQ